MPEVFSRNTRHERWHNTLHLSLLCIATNMSFAHTSGKNRKRIFLRPVPAKRICTYGNISEQGFGSLPYFTGCRDRPNRNFTTDVAEGKTRGHVRSKTPASRAFRMLSPNFQALFCEPLPRCTDV